jgi:magnesium-transporting ATPase (P-type)
MPQIAKIMIIGGIILIISGIIFWVGQKYFQWFGHLPGDIRIEKENFKLYIPITSMLLISILVSLILWVIRRFFQ